MLTLSCAHRLPPGTPLCVCTVCTASSHFKHRLKHTPSCARPVLMQSPQFGKLSLDGNLGLAVLKPFLFIPCSCWTTGVVEDCDVVLSVTTLLSGCNCASILAQVNFSKLLLFVTRGTCAFSVATHSPAHCQSQDKITEQFPWIYLLV